MSYHTPKTPTPIKPQDPVINMREMQEAMQLNTGQQGYTSTYLANATNAAQLAAMAKAPTPGAYVQTPPTMQATGPRATLSNRGKGAASLGSYVKSEPQKRLTIGGYLS